MTCDRIEVRIDHEYANEVNFTVDSGATRTILTEEDWEQTKKTLKQKTLKLKKTKKKFRPFGVKQSLQCLGKVKLNLETESKSSTLSNIFVVKNAKESLLGIREAERLGVLQINPKGSCIEKARTIHEMEKKDNNVEANDLMSGGMTQDDIDAKMKSIKESFSNVFSDRLGRATKVDPVHVKIDPNIKPVQQKRRKIPIRYRSKFKDLLSELKEAGVIEGPLGTDSATGWIHNPVICDKKYGGKIRLTLDTRPMADAVKTAHFPIPTPEELRHEFKDSDRFSVLDMNHAFFQFPMDEDTQKL